MKPLSGVHNARRERALYESTTLVVGEPKARYRGEAEKDKGPVGLCPAERARQEAEPRVSSAAGLRSAETTE